MCYTDDFGNSEWWLENILEEDSVGEDDVHMLMVVFQWTDTFLYTKSES